MFPTLRLRRAHRPHPSGYAVWLLVGYAAVIVPLALFIVVITWQRQHVFDWRATAISALATLFALLTAGVFGRLIAEPLGQLVSAVQRFRVDVGGGYAPVALPTHAPREVQALSAAFDSMARENIRLFREAVQALHVRDDFLAAVSHDLKTPLTAIRAYAQIAEKRAARAGLDDPQVAEALAAIDAATMRMKIMIEELVATAALASGQAAPLALEALDFATLVGETAEEVRRVDAGREVFLRIELARPDAVIEGDVSRLRRVVANLLVNALKYSQGPVQITVRAEADDVLLRVQDSGIGIPPEDLPRIFERFHRASNAPAGTGTGIGLSACREIVLQHGGEITVHSTLGVGTAFLVRLPRVQPPLPPEVRHVPLLPAHADTRAG